VYTRELVALGLADTMARRGDVLRFFGWAPRVATAAQGPGAPERAAAAPQDA
jgi:NTE family protein